jgi:hypothetical protein
VVNHEPGATGYELAMSPRLRISSLFSRKNLPDPRKNLPVLAKNIPVNLLV